MTDLTVKSQLFHQIYSVNLNPRSIGPAVRGTIWMQTAPSYNPSTVQNLSFNGG